MSVMSSTTAWSFSLHAHGALMMPTWSCTRSLFALPPELLVDRHLRPLRLDLLEVD